MKAGVMIFVAHCTSKVCQCRLYRFTAAGLFLVTMIEMVSGTRHDPETLDGMWETEVITVVLTVGAALDL